MKIILKALEVIALILLLWAALLVIFLMASFTWFLYNELDRFF